MVAVHAVNRITHQAVIHCRLADLIGDGQHGGGRVGLF